MTRTIIILASTLIACYIFSCIGIYLYQDNFIFYPQERAITDKKLTTIMMSLDKRIVISSYKRSGDKAVIYFGGNAEDVSVSLLSLANALPEHSVYMMNYRGYGGSQGEPSEFNIHKDAINLYELIRPTHKKISVIGRSLGSGFAVRLSSEKNVENLVLITPYNSLEDLARDKFPIFPVGLLLNHKLQSYRYAPAVKAKTTILAAQSDSIVPRNSTQELYKSFSQGVASISTIEDSDHNSIIFSEDYYGALSAALSANKEYDR